MTCTDVARARALHGAYRATKRRVDQRKRCNPRGRGSIDKGDWVVEALDRLGLPPLPDNGPPPPQYRTSAFHRDARDRNLDGVMVGTVHVMYGLAGSGKSTLARQLCAEGCAVRFTLDEWMLRLYPGLDFESREYGAR